MGARIVAVALLSCWTLGAQRYPAGALHPPEVGVLMSFEHTPPSSFVKLLRRQVEEIFRPAGLRLGWEMQPARAWPKAYDRVVLIKFQGRCTMELLDRSPQEPYGTLSLGRTEVSDGEVIPYTTVDCDQVGRVVARAGREPGMGASQGLYVRLAARVVTHEMLHALLRSPGHHASDCLRPALRLDDLRFQPRLTPAEILALRKAARVSPSPSLAQDPRQPAIRP